MGNKTGIEDQPPKIQCKGCGHISSANEVVQGYCSLCVFKMVGNHEAIEIENRGLRAEVKLWENRTTEAANAVEAFEVVQAENEALKAAIATPETYAGVITKVVEDGRDQAIRKYFDLQIKQKWLMDLVKTCRELIFMVGGGPLDTAVAYGPDFEPPKEEDVKEMYITLCKEIEVGGPSPEEAKNAEELAKQFHEFYEELAPDFGYKTREASRKPWEEVPEKNKNLMIAVAGRILATRKGE